MAKTRRPRARPSRSSLILRWSAVAVLVLVGLLYYRPVRNYFDRSATVESRQAQVDVLLAQRAALEKRLRYVTSDAAVAREARRNGYVKPGERLFIVKGISRWRAAQRSGATIAPRER